MDVFQIQQTLINDYKSYVESFVSIRDRFIRDFVSDEYDRGKYWPESLVQLNPAFAPGNTVPELVTAGTLHPSCESIFRVGKDQTTGCGGDSMRLHRHQQDAIEIAQQRDSYVLTTGTGSGKSLAYFIPIINRVLRHRTSPGLKAIVVYPMNALCNSQLEELEKFLGPSTQSPVTFRRYTGQENEEERQEIRANPPDILLTNYVMLELILTRAEDKPLLDKARSLEFLVLDELHTYRGRQGADVAMLVRRVRERTGAAHLQCIGTSATMASDGTYTDRQTRVASVASDLFGTSVPPERVVGETLQPLFPDAAFTQEQLRQAVMDVIDGTIPEAPEEFLQHPLAAWIEATYGTEFRDRRFERVIPSTVTDGATKLNESLGIPMEKAASAIQTMLLHGYNLKHPHTARPIFAFRLHQFISRGDTVFSTLEATDDRYLTLDGQTVVPGEHDRRLYPLCFCRACGEAYFTVDIPEEQLAPTLAPREFRDLASQDESERQSGYLWMDTAMVSTADKDPFEFQTDRLPDQHLIERKDGIGPTSQIRKKLIPAAVETDGRIDLFDSDGPSQAWFIKGRLPFCMHCGETWDPNAGEFTKLGSLASEGRAGATTMISLKLVQALRGSEDLPDEAKKLLSFTDNRQDASLQAGHFNDFVVTSMLRAGILASLPNSGSQTYDKLPDAVLAALNLDHQEYAAPGIEGGLTVKRARDAFRDVLAYRIFKDLKRGWRVNQPNLEQLALLTIDFEALEELAGDQSIWQSLPETIESLSNTTTGHTSNGAAQLAWTHDSALPVALNLVISTDSETRKKLLLAILEHFRREGAIQARVLEESELISLKDRARNNLNDLWGFDDNEELQPANSLRVASSQRKGPDKAADLTPMSRTGREVANILAPGTAKLPTKLRLLVLHILTQALVKYGHFSTDQDGQYLLMADVLQWRKIAAPPTDDARVNAFFRDYYATLAESLPFSNSPTNIHGMQAREHTAQVPSNLRQKREADFSTANLPVMYCSPTMELGVDISSLNAVNLRNVPPTPANYAQRSGRAGRANQPAIVVTYCAANSPHDQYYFDRRDKMVAGVVTPPRIDLMNRELIESHMHAVWLAETNVRFSGSLAEVLDLADEASGIPIQEQIKHQLSNTQAQDRALARCRRILASMATDLAATKWYRDEWLPELLKSAPKAINRACDRWRSLYNSANQQIAIQHERANDWALTADERNRAKRLRDEAERQKSLLIDRQSMSNDFYTYRYLASEGFLPGYNFPRLPLTAFIPGRRGGKSDGEYLQRSRFIAISEYGPGNSIYYEGSRYRVERVSLPTSAEPDAGVTETIKVCEHCGYAHVGATVNADICTNPDCGGGLGSGFTNDRLLRLQNVITRRVERINSEEEERVRQGFDLKTAIQFGMTAQGLNLVRGELRVGGDTPDAALTFAPAARIWRINLGWRRRKDKASYGFWLDMNKGVWSRKEDPSNAAGTENPEVANDALQRVVPYVDDHQNALILTLKDAGLDRMQSHGAKPGPAHYLSLGYALKRGICIEFQLEDIELSMELLPDNDKPTAMLLTESSEGGAGVVGRLLDEPGALARVARAALEICHFNPDTGDDLGESQDCGIACYHCLLSYTNQMDHRFLDRLLIQDLLMEWTSGNVLTMSTTMNRESLRDELMKLAGSTLETQFIQWLYDQGHRLPDKAQVLIEDASARPDFFIEDGKVCIYVDGPVHEHPGTIKKDATSQRKLERLGYQVIRVTYPAEWPTEVRERTDIFLEGITS